MTPYTLGAALRVSPQLERLYVRLRNADGARVDEVAAELDVSAEQFTHDLQPLVEAGAVVIQDGVLRVSSPQQALSMLLAEQSRALTQTAARLTRISQALPFLQEPFGAPSTPVASAESPAIAPVDVEVQTGRDVPTLLSSWIEHSTGGLAFLRPDQWRLPSEPAMVTAVTLALQRGRGVRAIYPVRALQEAPTVVVGRAAIGEQIRVLPQVPTRLAIVGGRHALLPDPPGSTGDRRLAVRHAGLVRLLTDYFDRLWERAVALPQPGGGVADHDLRRLLLTELAHGARDEQIARRLGLGLRTVRRRIAELMIELGADTRFQAGVEAGRRGWL